VGAVALAAAVASGCVDTPYDEPESPPVYRPQALTLAPTRALAREVQDYALNYGDWSEDEIAIAQRTDLVIVDPNDFDVDRELVQRIQGGTDPEDPDQRVLVLCYVSVGEDLRTANSTDAEMAGDPRFVGDGTGPRVDPRGPYADGSSLSGIDPLGVPSNGGTGWASWYLDDVSVRNGAGNVGDGVPDRNAHFGGYFVNAGDPAWFDALQDMTADGPDGVAGLREILTTDYGRGLGCDGVFMDTFDTAAPNNWTDAGSTNETKFEWTAPGLAAFVKRLRQVYPDIVVLQNRALFFFNPYNNQYPFHPGDELDFVLFESYRLNSRSGDGNPDPYYYPDNRYNFTPKLMAEANRGSTFRVLSLGYAEGPPDQMSELTLIGESSLGYESLLEDIWVTEQWAGFRHYLTNSSIELVNEFVREHADRWDAEPPRWTSSYNDNKPGYPLPPGAPTPRVGIQQVESGSSSLTVRWDVALDLNRVGYAVYSQTEPFDFDADPALASATRIVLPHEHGTDYADGVGPGIYANEAVITGLEPGQTYYLVIRAFDDAAAANEDDNRVVLTGVPGGQPDYFGRLRASNGVSDLTYRFSYTGEAKWRQVFIDADRLTGSGFATDGIGADFLIENKRLYRYVGAGGDWAWSRVSPTFLEMIEGTIDGVPFVQWNFAQAEVGAEHRHTRLVFRILTPSDKRTSAVYHHVYTPTDPASPYHDYYAENDGERIYYSADISAAYTWKHIFIDEDADPGTGFPIGGVGAGFMIENGRLYRHDGAGWSWTRTGTAHMQVTGDRHDWWIERSDVGAEAGGLLHRVVFQANGGVGGFMAPIYAHRFSP
jgi:hypothetical protein